MQHHCDVRATEDSHNRRE